MPRRGMVSLRAAKRIAREGGATVEYRHKTGEVTFRHPNVDGGKPFQSGARRKDSPMALMGWLRKLERIGVPQVKQERTNRTRHPRICLNCNRGFLAKRSNAGYCSTSCRHQRQHTHGVEPPLSPSTIYHNAMGASEKASSAQSPLTCTRCGQKNLEAGGVGEVLAPGLMFPPAEIAHEIRLPACWDQDSCEKRSEDRRKAREGRPTDLDDSEVDLGSKQPVEPDSELGEDFDRARELQALNHGVDSSDLREGEPGVWVPECTAILSRKTWDRTKQVAELLKTEHAVLIDKVLATYTAKYAREEFEARAQLVEEVYEF